MKKVPVRQLENAFARLGRELSAISDAESAARLIVDTAHELIGWDACYLILYDPAKGGKLRSVLTMDTINGKRKPVHIVPPEKPSINMRRAIEEDGFLSLHDSPVVVDRAYSFGGDRRTLSHLFVPVRSGKRIIGVFSIQSYTKHAYNKNSLETFKALANQCAGALERIWAQEALAEVESRRTLIYNAIHALSANLDMEELYRIVYETVLAVMPCDDFLISTYDSEKNQITPVFAIENRARLFVSPYPADRGLAAHIIRTAQPCIFNNVEEMNASGLDFIIFTQNEDATQSILATPMILHGKAMGVISAQSYAADSYTADDLKLLELLGSHAAVTIENARLFARIQQMADEDSLTGAYVRRKFYEIAEKEFKRVFHHGGGLSLIMFDIDDFKKFNDTFGHKMGDLVLQITANACKNCIRSHDILARHGGEEFIILLPNTQLDEAARVAARLRECVELADLSPARDFLLKTSGADSLADKLRVTISVGLSSFDDSCIDIDTLVERADRAMYLSKSSGRNGVSVCLPGGKISRL